jgi:hypothetical protein
MHDSGGCASFDVLEAGDMVEGCSIWVSVRLFGAGSNRLAVLFRCFPTVTATVAVFVLFVGVVCRFCDPARGVRARAKLQSSDSVTLAWSTRHARTLGPCRSLWYAKPQRPSHGKRRQIWAC